jgi:hypothetical protein
MVSQPIPTLSVKDDSTNEIVRRERISGTPLVLVDHDGWHKFSHSWLNSNGSLNPESFLASLDCDHEMVPVITPNYDERCPIKEHMQLHKFISNYWMQGKSGAYLHQVRYCTMVRTLRS